RHHERPRLAHGGPPRVARRRAHRGPARRAAGRALHPLRDQGADVTEVIATRLRGTARVPGDKSISHRALILGALADGPSRIDGGPDGADVAATIACLRALGTAIDLADGRGSVMPTGAWHDGLVLDAANSGTTARLPPRPVV